MFRKLLEKLRGSSRAPEDLAVGTTRPGDFAEDPDVEPNPHEREGKEPPAGGSESSP